MNENYRSIILIPGLEITEKGEYMREKKKSITNPVTHYHQVKKKSHTMSENYRTKIPVR